MSGRSVSSSSRIGTRWKFTATGCSGPRRMPRTWRRRRCCGRGGRWNASSPERSFRRGCIGSRRTRAWTNSSAGRADRRRSIRSPTGRRTTWRRRPMTPRQQRRSTAGLSAQRRLRRRQGHPTVHRRLRLGRGHARRSGHHVYRGTAQDHAAHRSRSSGGPGLRSAQRPVRAAIRPATRRATHPGGRRRRRPRARKDRPGRPRPRLSAHRRGAADPTLTDWVSTRSRE
jgi:hypothetical protein